MKQHFAFAFYLILALALTAQAQRTVGAAVAGAVVDRQGHPVPGLTVSLIGQQGRRISTTTDRDGKFVVMNIPPGQVYYVEVYWGRELLYRQPVNVNGNIKLDVIRL